ncbi:hypothetical protein D3C78_1497200 [compost metagenome]
MNDWPNIAARVFFVVSSSRSAGGSFGIYDDFHIVNSALIGLKWLLIQMKSCLFIIRMEDDFEN